jgi:hypothetical protein
MIYAERGDIKKFIMKGLGTKDGKKNKTRKNTKK